MSSRKRPGKSRSPGRVAGSSLIDYAVMLDLANDTIMIRDLNDIIIYWNQGAERLYGWSRSEAVGEYVHTFLKTGFPGSLEEILSDFTASGHWEGVLEHSKKDGSRITVASRWTLHRGEDGRPTAYLEINNDITAQRKAEHALQKAHVELEKRVADRTAELREANILLQEQIGERRNAEEALRVLSLRLISAQEEERGRISRDLHDDLGQILTYMNLDLQRAAGLTDSNKKNELIRRVVQAGQEAHSRLRRLSALLRPPVLDDIGLRAAMETYVAEFSERTGIRTKLDFRRSKRNIPGDIATCVYRVLQEALVNVSQHAEASRVSVKTSCNSDRFFMQIDDDGRGFDPGEIRKDHPGGLAGMRQRAELLAGTLAIESRKAAGTRITISIPITEKKRA